VVVGFAGVRVIRVVGVIRVIRVPISDAIFAGVYLGETGELGLVPE